MDDILELEILTEYSLKKAEDYTKIKKKEWLALKEVRQKKHREFIEKR